MNHLVLKEIYYNKINATQPIPNSVSLEKSFDNPIN